MFGNRQFVAARVLTVAVFSVLLLIAARSTQAQTETVLYTFTGGSDGGNPYSHLTSDGAGNLYGTTFGGGDSASGTVFELSPNGSGGWNETVIYSFTGGADGANPWFSPVIFDGKGNLYGTTCYGGEGGTGVVFELTFSGANWTESVLHDFQGGEDGAYPINGLAMDQAGNLYGTTYAGGEGGGVVFEMSPSGGSWAEQVIYEDVGAVWDGVTVGPAGNIFGNTPFSVFELSPNGNGGWNPTTIHKFNEEGGPADVPVFDKAGNLYTTTTGGSNFGTVSKLSPGDGGRWTRQGLHWFRGGQYGSLPWSSIVFDPAGNIYGTTVDGGKYGYGIVFELMPQVGTDGYKEKVLWSFTGTDGSQPWGGLIMDGAGNLYGTTDVGGSHGAGVVFEVTP